MQPLRAPFVAAVARVTGKKDEAELMTHDAQSARFVPVDDLASQLTDAADWQTRAHAAETLADVDAPGVVDALMRALRDPSAEVAAAAAAALAAQRDGRALDALRAVLRNLDGYLSPVTRAAALSGLARRLADTEFGPVFDAINDPDAEVSLAAINAIAAIAKRVPQMAAARLLPVVRNESGYFLPLVRLAAVSALARTGVLTAALANELLRTRTRRSRARRARTRDRQHVELGVARSPERSWTRLRAWVCSRSAVDAPGTSGDIWQFGVGRAQPSAAKFAHTPLLIASTAATSVGLAFRGDHAAAAADGAVGAALGVHAVAVGHALAIGDRHGTRNSACASVMRSLQLSVSRVVHCPLLQTGVGPDPGSGGRPGMHPSCSKSAHKPALIIATCIVDLRAARLGDGIRWQMPAQAVPRDGKHAVAG